jgi:hypothetical protein
MHFHLAATINAATDIPLVPAMNSSVEGGGVVHKFSLHWLNNKEIYFSMEAEKILQELAKVALRREDSGVERELMSSEVGGREQQQQHALWRNQSSPVRGMQHPREGIAVGTPSEGIQPSSGGDLLSSSCCVTRCLWQRSLSRHSNHLIFFSLIRGHDKSYIFTIASTCIQFRRNKCFFSLLQVDGSRVAEPKLFFSAPAPTFKKFRLWLPLRLRLEL